MKRYVLMLALAAGVTTMSFAQKEAKEEQEGKLKRTDVPAAVKNAFTQHFAGATKVKWEKEKANYEVNFVQGGHEMSALFNSAGTLEETEMEIKAAQLPSAVTSYVQQHYKGSKIKEAARITKGNGEVNYEAELKGMDVLFDASGKFLKEVKE